jgi:hypothetical protein
MVSGFWPLVARRGGSERAGNKLLLPNKVYLRR